MFLAISDITGLPYANASLLDEGTAAGEAMAMCFRLNKRPRVLLSDQLHPHVIEVIRTRARLVGEFSCESEKRVYIRFSSGFRSQVEVLPIDQMDFSKKDVAGVFFQYPDTTGNVFDPSSFVARAKENGVSIEFPSFHTHSHRIVDCGHLWFGSACSLPVETTWGNQCGYLLW